MTVIHSHQSRGGRGVDVARETEQWLMLPWCTWSTSKNQTQHSGWTERPRLVLLIKKKKKKSYNKNNTQMPKLDKLWFLQSFQIITCHTIWDDPNEILAVFENRRCDKICTACQIIRWSSSKEFYYNVLFFCLGIHTYQCTRWASKLCYSIYWAAFLTCNTC